MMLLVIISNINFSAKIYRTRIRFYNTVYKLKDSGFSCSVITNKGNTFATFDFNINIVKLRFDLNFVKNWPFFVKFIQLT